MKREIKFRVWAATDDGMKMVYLDEAVCDNGLWFSSNTHIDDYAEAVMQFTGLKDKNGKEIWEGDILSVFGGKRFTVQFLKYSWRVVPVPGFHSGLGNKLHILRSEVIGNIYSNPELLTPSPGGYHL